MIIGFFFTQNFWVGSRWCGRGRGVLFQLLEMENKLTIEDTWETEECLCLIRKEQNASNRRKKVKKIAGPGGNKQDEMTMLMNEQMVHCVLAQRIPKTLEKLVKNTLMSFFFF